MLSSFVGESEEYRSLRTPDANVALRHVNLPGLKLTHLSTRGSTSKLVKLSLDIVCYLTYCHSPAMTTMTERDFIGQRAMATSPLDVASPPDRLSLTPRNRILLAATSAGMIGGVLGLSHGSNMTSLRFRAENAHRLPTSQQGWFLYHKSKNYAVALGGVKEAARMSTRLAVWTSLFLITEEVIDRSRHNRTALSTVVAGLSTAGAFSLYSMSIPPSG